MSRTLHLALHPYGVGGPAQHGLWKDPRIAKNISTDIRYYIRQAQAAEHGLFDALFTADSQFVSAGFPSHYLNRLEPLTMLSAVATHTRHLGLVATASSTYNSPFNLARRFASLDHISGGRAGWNVVTGVDSGTSRNFGLDEHLDYTTRYSRALECVEVARGLWDSYEDDAFPADVEHDIFLDPSKLHQLNHEGEHFKVAGPLNISRSPQGQPVIFQAGVSEEGRDLAARVAEGIYAPGDTSLEQAQEYYADVKRRAVSYGRNPEHIKILIHGDPIVAATDEAALRREREIFEEDHDFDRSLALLGRSFGAYDFSTHDLDAPFPDVAHLAEKGGRTGAVKLIARAKAQNLTLRQVVETVSELRRSPFVGAPQTVADAIERWFDAKAFDGIVLAFRVEDELNLFVDGVVSILQKRGLFRTEYTADTLRGHLGLPVPANRWTTGT
ncbi:LLM class flavin-dependent oxidoreductase [Streptomyces violaceusniger]|uniref:LLM class flavin-dependent oxidoreductase n=1 Tax=Streptomyces violaceusniger TaxID=68280 RepID=UPI000998A704|nr:LLM class flavin-dependent oxidoreductase [Streptomyces hygroscopicus]AQW56483.1 monooxygenase [Streptomyces hygroscopicus]